MKFLLVLCALFLGALAFPNPKGSRVPAVPCDDTCTLPECRCSSVSIPGNFAASETPQFVLFTFDDAVTITNIDFYREALYNHNNPNTCPISATFFVSHEYTDYTLIHELHSRGFEIAGHSITHQVVTDYWKNATVQLLTREFADQKIMMQQFAKIPGDDIQGIRMPFLQMTGNSHYEMLQNNGFSYDLSWSSRLYMDPGMWPYTLKHLSTQDCVIPQCPTESFPDIWVIPMTHWNNDNKNHTCSMTDACVHYDTMSYLDWMKNEFRRHYESNRSPLGFYIHAAWFLADENRYTAYKEFIDYLGTFNDVFLTSATEMLDWVKNPKTVSDMRDPENISCRRVSNPPCTPKSCQLYNEQNNERWLNSCVAECPPKYPWLNNPLGNN